jgi:hypothetical protein
MRTRLGLLTLAIAATAVAAPASADPYKTATLSASAAKFQWTGSGSGISKPIGLDGEPSNLGCGSFPAGNDCQDIVLDVTDKGDLKVTLAIDGAQCVPDPSGFFGDCVAGYPDIDIYPYKSDATGKTSGDPLTTDGATSSPTETFTLKGLNPGYYDMHVEFFNGVQATYSATAELLNAQAPVVVPPPGQTASGTPAPQPTPAASPTPTPTPTPAPAPAAKKKHKAKASCAKKAKKIKNARKRKAALKRCKRHHR